MAKSSTGDGDARKTPRFVRWAVMLGIVIALNIFFFVARSIILPEPQYDSYCSPQVTEPTQVNDQQPASDYFEQCQKQFDAAEHQYAMYAFSIEVAFGVVAIIIGILPLGSSIVSSGLSYGGVLALLVGSIQYWSDAGTWIRFAVSLIALAALIYIGFKKFRD